MRFRLDDKGDFVRDVIDDEKLLINNRKVFYIINDEEAYNTTCDGFFDLYKNGKLIAKEIFDSEMEVTKEIHYGSLKKAFRRVTKEQLKELLKD